jgi:hypothetical protein
MAEPTLTYQYPAWGLMPPLKHRSKAVHAVVHFDDDSAGAVEVIHNFTLPFGAPIPQPEWLHPMVVVNATAGGPNAPIPLVTEKDGNSIVLGRAASGPGTAVTYDVWMFSHKLTGWFD